jgi:ribosome-binding protein aMBF1 (putative translation factor)
MKATKRQRLEAAGFRVGGVKEFLGLSEEEEALVEMKVRLVEMLKGAREAKGITQEKLAEMMGSSQSRVAKLEGSCAEASLDLICRALFAVGVTTRELGKVLGRRRAA